MSEGINYLLFLCFKLQLELLCFLLVLCFEVHYFHSERCLGRFLIA